MFKKPATWIPVLIDTPPIDLVTFKEIFSTFSHSLGWAAPVGCIVRRIHG
jgi:hypothetical protein